MKIKQDLMLIGGALVGSSDGKWDLSVNPANEEVIGRSPAATKEDVDRAVAAADAAFPAWAAMTVDERSAILMTFADRIAERADELLEVEVLDTGNTITPMRGDVNWAIKSLKYYIGLGLEMKGESVPATPGNLHFSVREPYGVVGKILPFNHPVMFAVSRTAPALVAGNTVVVKPAETSPLSTLILAEIAKDVFPAGVFNIVTGDGRVVGDAISRHPKVKRLAFIGSVPTGLAIQRAAAETCVKNVTLELGGKNPMIVFPDVDIDEVAQAAVNAMNFTWQGQSCGSMSRLMVHADIYDAVLERVVTIVKNLRLGDPLLDDTDMGPINSAGQWKKVQDYVEIAKADGAKLETGGKRPEGAMFEKGYWIEPTVFSGVTKDMRIAQEEVFGPILSVLKWSEIDEAVEIANATEFGLTAAIWTNDINNALTTSKRVKSGYHWINGYSAHFIGVNFGGVGNSGVGREEGLEDLLSYTEAKTINIMLKAPSLKRS
ncbi:aldehyde dehydrogenase family protein [Actibacterium sp. D379-3]